MRPLGPVPLFLACLLLSGNVSPDVPESGDPVSLSPGSPLERALAGGETHLYRTELAPGTPVLVTVEQRGIDLVVTARGPGAEAGITVDSLNGHWGPEALFLVPAGAGSLQVEIRSLDRNVPPGRYSLTLESLPEASAERRAAEAATAEAGRLASEGALPKAAAAYREARDAWRRLGETRREAEALSAFAILEQNLGELQPALASAEEALKIWRAIGEPHREAVFLGQVGMLRRNLGDLAGAREAVEGSLAVWRRLGERFDEALTRNSLCYLEQVSGQLPAALSCYEEILAVFRAAGDARREALALNNLGGVLDLRGEPDAALASYERALALRRALEDRPGEAQTLNNIAVVHRRLGEWQEALRLYGQVREILAPLGNRLKEAEVLGNIGYAYDSLGEPRRALAFFEEALARYREVGDRPGEIITLNNLGLAQRGLGDLEKALAHHRQALQLALAAEDRQHEAISRLRLGRIRMEQGAAAEALTELDQALQISLQIGSPLGTAEALHLRGQALARGGRAREALPVLSDALARRRSLRDRAGTIETLEALAEAERALGETAAARAHAEEAVRLVEDLRAGFVLPHLRTAFLAARRRAYTLLVELLMTEHAAHPGKGRDREALAVSERSRARSLLDALSQEIRIDNAGSGSARGELQERRRALRRGLSALAARQMDLESGGRAGSGPEVLSREMERLSAELDTIEAEILRQNPAPSPADGVPSIGMDDIRALLDPGTLFLEFSLGEERSYLWAVGPDVGRAVLLPPQRKIEDLVRQTYAAWSTVEAGTASQSGAPEELARLLLEPVWNEVAQSRRVVVVPDAALHFLPFGALPVPLPGATWSGSRQRAHLLVHREVVALPSAAVLAAQRQRSARRPPAARPIAIFADPVFSRDDPRRSASGPATGAAVSRAEAPALLPVFERLPASRREAEAIARLVPAGQPWTALDFAADREAVLSTDLRSFRVLHFATHAVVHPRNPELSGLVLSLVDQAGRPRDGFLRLQDLDELDLAADLVVLSGCRTALGEEVRGEGILGLTRGFLDAGAPRVVASLWKVQDRATAALMERFYTGLWRQGLSPAAALRAAQLALREDPRYRAPYSWAGFVLQGDWR